MVERRFEEDQMQELSSWWQQSITEQLDRAPTAWMKEVFGELEEQPIFNPAQSE
jgi:hypothetical protein